MTLLSVCGWTDPDSTCWLVVDRAGILLSFAVLGSIIVAFYKVFLDIRRKQHLVRVHAEMAGIRSGRPVALLTCFAGGSIEPDAMRFLRGRHPGHDFFVLPAGAADPHPGPLRFPLVEFHHSGDLDPGVAHADLQRLRAVERWLKQEGYTEIHLFMRSTVAFGCVAGGLFTNWGAVFIYHRHDNHGYEYWFPLSETKRGEVAADPVGAVADAVVQRLTRRAAAPQQPAAPSGGE
ncbi:MAG TPA: hypothetical protein VFQ76_18285 [Longimicrobiaceae bacterium]|nr:hypothetical protein [Longimicrobiaceae bacterium]